MRIMTIDAIFINVVFIGLYARNALALTGGVRQRCVATQAETTTCVNHEKFWIIWMVESWPMAVLTGDDAMQVLSTDINHIIVAFRTIFVHLLFARVAVLERLILPDFLIGFVVIAVHEAVLAGAKIVRNVKRPEQQECGDNANDHE